jgi:hypothetical protein
MPKTAGADRALLAGGLYTCVARLLVKMAGLYVDFRAQGDFWVLGVCYLRGFRLYFEWFGLFLVYKKKRRSDTAGRRALHVCGAFNNENGGFICGFSGSRRFFGCWGYVI